MIEFLHYVLLDVEHRQGRYSNVCVKRYIHPLEYLQSPLSEKKKKKKKNPTETPDHFWPFRWPVVGGDKFSPLLAPILGPEKKSGDVTLFSCS